MELREAKIREIKNLDLIYIYTTDSIFKGNTDKYIGAKLVYNDNQVIDIDYTDKHFGLFVARVLERYKKEKDVRKIVLLGDFTKKFISGSYDKIELQKEEKANSYEVPYFKVDNKNLMRYEAYLKEALKMIISSNIKFDNFTIGSINGYNHRYMVKYLIGGKEYTFPMVLYNDNDELYFKINRIGEVNTDIKGYIKPSLGRIIVSYDDKDIKTNVVYDANNDLVERKIVSSLDTIYYDDAKDTLLQEDIDILKFYFDLFQLDMPDKIIKVDDSTFILSKEESILEDEDSLYTIDTYLVSINDAVTITKNTINGFTKYNNQINVVLDKVTHEYTMKKMTFEDKEYLLCQIRKSNKRGNEFMYQAYEVNENCDLKNGFKVNNKYVLDSSETLYDIKKNIIKKRGGK